MLVGIELMKHKDMYDLLESLNKELLWVKQFLIEDDSNFLSSSAKKGTWKLAYAKDALIYQPSWLLFYLGFMLLQLVGGFFG